MIPLEPLPRPRVHRAYPGPACPYCGAPLAPEAMAAGPELCLDCAGSFEATPFSPPSPYLPPLALAEAGPAGATPCAAHPGNAAVGNCPRCGIFLCTLCRTEVDSQGLCPPCFDRLAAEKGLPTLRNSLVDLQGLALLSGFGGLLFFYLGVVTGPLTLVLAGFAVRQKRRGLGSGGWGGILLACGLGIAQIGSGLFFLFSLFKGWKS
ncbi:MAG TPA: hypothetical protein VGR07_08295 [Thermoanaerobaculia bacterium]|nr:hypothetical protein [Thermoanaerobaculia bacterium]